MSNRKVWFITGAGRGMGVDFAKAVQAAGHARALITIASQEPPPRRFIAGGQGSL